MAIDTIILNGVSYPLAGSGGSGTGLTEDVKQALLDCFANTAWTTADGQDYYDALEEALNPPAGLSYITAVYTQSGTVYDTDSLDSLKTNLVVTAHYDNSTSAVVTNYTLSGTLTTGTSIITVTYGGKTTTFSVTVTHADTSILNWDFTQSLTDSKQGITATLGQDVSRSSNGLTCSGNDCEVVMEYNVGGYNQLTLEVDITSFTAPGAGSSNNTVVVLYSTSSDFRKWIAYNGNNGWRLRDNYGTWRAFDNTDATLFNGKTMKLQVNYSASEAKLYCDNTLIGTVSIGQKQSTTYLRLFGASMQGMVVTGFRVYEGLV